MNLKFLTFKKEKEELMLIGKTGHLRIKKDFAKKYNLSKSDKWVFALDSESQNAKKGIYLIRNYKENSYSKKMICNNESWSFDAKPIISELKLNIPINCKLIFIKTSHFEGFNLQINS